MASRRKAKQICSVDGCKRTRLCKLRCALHYKVWQRMTAHERAAELAESKCGWEYAGDEAALIEMTERQERAPK